MSEQPSRIHAHGHAHEYSAYVACASRTMALGMRCHSAFATVSICWLCLNSRTFGCSSTLLDHLSAVQAPPPDLSAVQAIPEGGEGRGVNHAPHLFSYRKTGAIRVK